MQFTIRQKIIHWTVAGVFVTIASPAFCASSAIAGRAVSVFGRVLIRAESDADSQMRKLKPGDPIGASDVINTASDGGAKLLFTDRTVIDLGPSTLFKMEEYRLKQGGDREVGVAVDYGKIRASVNTPVSDKGRFKIKTRSLTMGVRGTEFLVAAGLESETGAPRSSANATQVTVLEGKVAVESNATSAGAGSVAQPVMLTEGTKLDSSKMTGGGGFSTSSSAAAGAESSGASSGAQSLSKEELTQARSEAGAMKTDLTFSNNVNVTSAGGANIIGSEIIGAALGSTGGMDGFQPPDVRDLGINGTFGPTMGMQPNNQPNQTGQGVAVSVTFNR